MSDENFDIDAAMESGDPELMAKALAALESEGTEMFAEQDEAEDGDGFSFSDEGKKPEAKSEDAGDDKGDGDASGHEDSDSADEQKKVIKSKDGRHEIPYDVLENAREREREARNHAQELQRQLDEANAKIQQTEVAMGNAKTAMERAGVDVESAFNDPDAITAKEVKEAEEDFGKDSAYAKSVRAMFKMQQQQNSNVQQAQQVQETAEDNSANEARQAFLASSDLTNWHSSDPKRWRRAEAIDSILQQDPQWASKSVSERFAEVVKRTKESFGDALAPETPAQRAKKIIDKTEQAAPDSLSDLGQTPVSVKDDYDALKDMTPEQLEEKMYSMSQAQIDALFARSF